MIVLLFICAFALSGVAAFYSIAGLMAIFAAAPMPIAIMGSTLEVTKLVVASWLYRNWKPIPKLMKGYLTFALVVLMFLTSMGIFGFLSKAHLDQGVPTADVAAKVALIDEKIKTEKETIDAARKALAQLDEQVNQTLSRTATQSNDSGVSRSVAIRRAQSRERAQLTAEIGKSQTAIATLNEQRAPVAAELRKVEAEVGPIKYIAQLIYGQEAAQDTSLLEKAVQWVTILIVAVFDPLAVVLLIAANWSLANRRPAAIEPPPSVSPEPPTEDKPSKPEFNWRDFPYLTQPFAHFKNLKPVVAKQTVDEEPVPQENHYVAPEEQHIEPSADTSLEHRAYVPDDEEFWRSRPHPKKNS